MRVPVNSFEFQPCDRTTQVGYLIRLLQHRITPTLSIQRLRRGLLGYLILFAPHAFVPQRQQWPSKSPSPLVFLLISTHLTATLEIPLASTMLKQDSLCDEPKLSFGLRSHTYQAAYAPFTPNKSG